jgi:DNA-directed RNA polymerase subunit N (RpoN/RPB10)
MSDNYLKLIPTDPTLVPAPASQQSAVSLLKSLLPNAVEIENVVTDNVTFVDCGSTLETIRCPSCSAAIKEDWWIKAMDRAADQEFSNLMVDTPCCRKATSLNDLKYDWPQGFARFQVKALNPGIREFSPTHQAKLEEILGCPLRQIWSHI